MPKLADTNAWLALTLSKHTFHEAARAWFESLPSQEQVLFCRSTQQSYLRLLTTTEVLARYGIRPLTNAEAWNTYSDWLEVKCVSFADESAGLEAHWKAWAALKTSSPKLWMDANLAAFAISGGYQLVTTDKSFTQYQGLDLQLLMAS